MAGAAVPEAPPVGPTDPSFANVVLLCGFDGVDGSTTFTDASNSGHTITAEDDAQIDTAQKQFGTGSMLLDSDGDYASVATDSDFAYGTGDFTIEFWMRPASVSGVQLIFDQKSTVSEVQPSILLNNDALVYLTQNTTRISIGSISVDTWYHVAVCRASGSTRMFLNGVAGVTVFSDSGDYPAPPTAVYIGTAGNAVGNASFDFGGHIDEIRITKGVARYTDNFTPPAAAFPRS